MLPLSLELSFLPILCSLGCIIRIIQAWLDQSCLWNGSPSFSVELRHGRRDIHIWSPSPCEGYSCNFLSLLSMHGNSNANCAWLREMSKMYKWGENMWQDLSQFVESLHSSKFFKMLVGVHQMQGDVREF